MFSLCTSPKEASVERVFKQNSLVYPVPLTFETDSPLQEFPWLRPRDFLETLANQNDLSHLLAGFNNMTEARDLLTVFWTRFEKIHPGFQLFQDIRAGKKEMHQCIPCYIHGDEGTTYKRSGVLILSWQSPLGFGTSKRDRELSLNLESMGESGLPLNFAKSGMYSRMLSFVCHKDWLGCYQQTCNFLYLYRYRHALLIYIYIFIYLKKTLYIEKWPQKSLTYYLFTCEINWLILVHVVALMQIKTLIHAGSLQKGPANLARDLPEALQGLWESREEWHWLGAEQWHCVPNSNWE